MIKYLLLLIAVGSILVLTWRIMVPDSIKPILFGLQQSGHGFPLGNEVVDCSYGYYGNGDRLAFAIILSWPAKMVPSMHSQDPRCDHNGGAVPLVRSADGVMRPVEMDGHVYLFLGDELRVIRVKMNEHTDTVGFDRAGSMEGIWNYLQQFRVDE